MNKRKYLCKNLNADIDYALEHVKRKKYPEKADGLVQICSKTELFEVVKTILERRKNRDTKAKTNKKCRSNDRTIQTYFTS